MESSTRFFKTNDTHEIIAQRTIFGKPFNLDCENDLLEQ